MKPFLDIEGNPHEPTSTDEVKWRISAYPIVFHPTSETKILMVKPTWHNQWELPGGGIELGESIKDAAIRECLEESGYSILLHSVSPYHIGEEAFYVKSSHEFFHAIHLFINAQLVNLTQDKDKVKEMGETSEVGWVELADLTEENTFRIIWPVVQLLQRQNLDLFF